MTTKATVQDAFLMRIGEGAGQRIALVVMLNSGHSLSVPFYTAPAVNQFEDARAKSSPEEAAQALEALAAMLREHVNTTH